MKSGRLAFGAIHQMLDKTSGDRSIPSAICMTPNARSGWPARVLW